MCRAHVDQHAQAVIRADQFTDHGADHRQGGTDAQSTEEDGQGGGISR